MARCPSSRPAIANEQAMNEAPTMEIRCSTKSRWERISWRLSSAHGATMGKPDLKASSITHEFTRCQTFRPED